MNSGIVEGETSSKSKYWIVCMHIFLCMYVCMYVCIYVRMFVFMEVYIWMHVNGKYTCMCISLYDMMVCMWHVWYIQWWYVFIYVFMYFMSVYGSNYIFMHVCIYVLHIYNSVFVLMKHRQFIHSGMTFKLIMRQVHNSQTWEIDCNSRNAAWRQVYRMGIWFINICVCMHAFHSPLGTKVHE